MTTIPNAENAVDELTDAASDAAGELATSAKGWMGQAEDCMRSHPMTSVLVAVGVGAIVGYLLSCRR